ncbi:MAG TPA: efflux RND transporter periplasmic adaptor subunit [Opitutales bacterium]|nr:efflux RND transporter periplasmic adaptor subunit [Opitutales bacterium]
MKTKKRYLVITLMAFLGILAAWYIGERRCPSYADLEIPRTVGVTKVTRQNLFRAIELSAEFQAYDQAVLYAKVAGYLKEINFDIGDRVLKADKIAVIDVPELDARLASCKAAYEIAKLDYDRINGVRQSCQGLVAQDRVDKANAECEVAKANYEHALTFKEYSTIVAPYDGIITKRFVDAGAMIQLGTDSRIQPIAVVEIADNKRLRLIFPVPESVVARVNVGDCISVKIQSIDKRFEGTVARTASRVDKSTRTMEAQADVYNPALLITPGMYATVTIVVDKRSQVLALPVQAIVSGEAPYVWLVNDCNQIERRPVALGLKTPDWVEITHGLSEGDLVVYGNTSAIVQGTRVHPKIVEIPTFVAAH